MRTKTVRSLEHPRKPRSPSRSKLPVTALTSGLIHQRHTCALQWWTVPCGRRVRAAKDPLPVWVAWQVHLPLVLLDELRIAVGNDAVNWVYERNNLLYYVVGRLRRDATALYFIRSLRLSAKRRLSGMGFAGRTARQRLVG